MKALEIFLQFVEEINLHDPKALKALMTTDHLFVDSLGQQVQGATLMEHGWKGYFSMCPDYWMRIGDVIAEEETVLAAGAAGGTINGQSWQIPAAWKAVIRENKVAEWRVYADNKPVYAILARRQSSPS